MPHVWTVVQVSVGKRAHMPNFPILQDELNRLDQEGYEVVEILPMGNDNVTIVARKNR